MKSRPVSVEFLITLNENIVIQRLFNVREFKPQAVNSLELYEYFREISEGLQARLKLNTLNYLSDNYYEIVDDPSFMETSKTNDDENFKLQLIIGDRTVHSRIFNAKAYPPKVRYTMDVRRKVKEIMRELAGILSSDEISTEYLDQRL